jgi:protoheme IX farnesyltransferase
MGCRVDSHRERADRPAPRYPDTPLTTTPISPPPSSLATATAARKPLAPGVFWELAKPGITRLVCITAAIGFMLGLYGHEWTSASLIISGVACMIGTAFSAAGANARNMWWERDRDAQMHRTARRPIPSGVLAPSYALLAGLVFSLSGVGVLLTLCGPAAAIVSAFTILSYVLVYTPLKPVTAWATLIGAVPGALPPLIGYCAALSLSDPYGPAAMASLVDPRGWSLFALMFVWQIPHFLAIAWMHREDYERGGHRVLALIDPRGTATAWLSLLTAIALVPMTLLPLWLMPDRLGWLYGVVAVVTGAIFVAQCVVFVRDRSRPRARAVFIGSIVHLPLLLCAIVLEVILRVVV